MKFGYDIKLEQTQKLVLTPEMRQAILVLQLSSIELEKLVNEQLMENPLLEYASNFATKEKQSEDSDSNEEIEITKSEDLKNEAAQVDWDKFLREHSSYEGVKSEYEYKEPLKDWAEYSAVWEETLADHLLEQLQFTKLTESERKIGEYIIESLDENGYMTSSLTAIAEKIKAPMPAVIKAHKAVRAMEPAGVGAVNLRDCLKLQLSVEGELTTVLEAIIDYHMDDVAANKPGKIAKALEVSTSLIHEAIEKIKGLEPRPGCNFACPEAPVYIIPDAFVEKAEEGHYVSRVNEKSCPQLMINKYYKQLLEQDGGNEEINQYLQERTIAAMNLIKNIEQRRITIEKVVKEITDCQQEFFAYGPKFLKPLTLKQVADKIGVHESTVSRAAKDKYIQSNQGVFEFKYFFGSSIHSDSGQSISTEAIRTVIKEMIENENREEPLSDQAISEMLANRNMEISRRTVSKYREEMKIPTSGKRKIRK